jgi:hypothetical protein
VRKRSRLSATESRMPDRRSNARRSLTGRLRTPQKPPSDGVAVTSVAGASLRRPTRLLALPLKEIRRARLTAGRSMIASGPSPRSPPSSRNSR